jgi:hypothetical protein
MLRATTLAAHFSSHHHLHSMVPEEPLSTDAVAPFSEHNVRGFDGDDKRHNGPAVANDRVLGGRPGSSRGFDSGQCRVGAGGFAVRQLQA